MPSDSHASAKGWYQIRSLYFDNASDLALWEKMSGISEREKFRIRFYDFDTSYIRLEKKVKRAELGYKISSPLSLEQTKKILSGNVEWMKDSKDALLVELYGKMKFSGLRPKTIVDYVREPFVYEAGNVRVTLDYHIKTGLYETDLLSKEIPTIEACPGTYILEVKYDHFLPDVIRDIIQLGNRRAGAFSKYAICRRFEFE